MLTEAEKQAILNCKYFGGYWGARIGGVDYFDPASTLAKMRGAEFDFYDAAPHDANDYYFYANKSSQIIHQALQDIAEWLNFDPLDYYEIAVTEKEKMFERLKK